MNHCKDRGVTLKVETCRERVAPWSHPGSKTKQERQACKESRAENQVRGPGTPPIDKTVLLKAPRLNESS